MTHYNMKGGASSFSRSNSSAAATNGSRELAGLDGRQSHRFVGVHGDRPGVVSVALLGAVDGDLDGLDAAVVAMPFQPAVDTSGRFHLPRISGGPRRDWDVGTRGGSSIQFQIIAGEPEQSLLGLERRRRAASPRRAPGW